MTVGQTLDEVAKKFPNDVRVVNKQFVVHPQIATLPAYAACAANKQGKWPEFEHELFKRSWPTAEGAPGPRLDREKLGAPALEQLAADLKLDVNKFKADMNGPQCKSEVEADQRQMQAVGTSGTPTIFVNGKIYMGQRSPEGFAKVVEDEIKKADEVIKTGVKAEDYYSKLMSTAKKSL
jgi:protein-disulfide isomerase